MIGDSLRRVLTEEAEAIRLKAENLPDGFEKAVRMILECEGRVVTCGLGKSGHIAKKTSATFASTGTPSLFLHAAEAVHGDLGMVTNKDIVILYTYSGETSELIALYPPIQSIGAKILVMTGRPESSAGRLADLVLDSSVPKEACPNNLAPTTSTTVMLALSDALAVAVMEQRGFGSGDFAKYHPSGSLGRKLLLRVSDVMRKGEDVALAHADTPFIEVLGRITKSGAGGACIVDETGVLLGFISDGDVRRHILNHPHALETPASELMTLNPASLPPDMLASDALEAFQNHSRKIGEMMVLENGKLAGLLVLKDLLRSGIF